MIVMTRCLPATRNSLWQCALLPISALPMTPTFPDQAVAVLFSGGDSPGMNAFLRAIVRLGLNRERIELDLTRFKRPAAEAAQASLF